MKQYDLTDLDISDGAARDPPPRRGPEPAIARDGLRPRRPARPSPIPSPPRPPPRRRPRPPSAGRPQDDRDREPDGRHVLLLERPGRPAVRLGRHRRAAADTTVCIIEAMKVFTDIPAGVSGTIAEVLVKSGQPVEFGQPLFRVVPA